MSRLLARNAALNAFGQMLPLLLAIPVLPFVLATLGAERFAVLTLAWTVIGYFGFLDLGLGRAATKFVAGMVGADRRSEVPGVVWSSLALQAALGIAGAAVIALLAPVLSRDVLSISDPVLHAETRATLIIVAVGLPLVLLSGTLSGVLEAHQRFDLVNAVRVPLNAASFAVPAAGAALGWSLPAMVLGIVLARAAGLVSYALCAAHVAGGLRPMRPQGPVLRKLLGFGGWLTLSLLAVPLFTYAERFLIGGMRSLTELAYYAVPFEIMARSAVIPSAIAMTLFPAFSHAQQSGVSVADLFRRPARILLLLQWPLLVTVWLFAGDILGVWMGPDVRAAATTTLRLLAVAFFFNAFAQIALAGVQGLGRPDLKAKLDLVLLPAYLATAVLLIPRYGITGAAAAKLAFTLLDTALLFLFARRLGAPSITRFVPHVRAVAVAAALIAAGVGAAAAAPMSARVVVCLVAITFVSAVLWRHALEPADRRTVRRLFARPHPITQ